MRPIAFLLCCAAAAQAPAGPYPSHWWTAVVDPPEGDQAGRASEGPIENTLTNKADGPVMVFGSV